MNMKIIAYSGIFFLLIFCFFWGFHQAPESEMLQKKKIYDAFVNYKPDVGENHIDKEKLMSVLCAGHDTISCRLFLEGKTDAKFKK